MKRVFVRSLWLAVFVTVVGCAASYGQTGMRASMGSPGGPVSVSYFYENLAPDGEWFHDASLGWCWTPYDMSVEWRPYSDGHWEYTDYGWSWVSNERWGWATYHYGRWFFDDSYGWAWVPGTEWAPAWVAWRYGDDWIGWAPLPPTAGWDASAGLAFADANAIRSDEWCFVPRRHVLDVKLRLQVTSVARNVTLLGSSRDATRFDVRNGRPVNVGIDVAQVERNVGRPVPRATIVDVATPGQGRGQRTGRSGVGFYRPTVRPEPTGQAPAPPQAQHQATIPDATMQRQRDAQQRKVESDLKAEQARLARDQKAELRAQGRGPAVDEAAEQQAFQAHAAQQRRVVEQRMQKQVVKPPAQGRGQARNKGGN